jgi:hypothetical protein
VDPLFGVVDEDAAWEILARVDGGAGAIDILCWSLLERDISAGDILSSVDEDSVDQSAPDRGQYTTTAVL